MYGLGIAMPGNSFGVLIWDINGTLNLIPLFWNPGSLFAGPKP